MKNINENAKVTLTIGQLNKLIREHKTEANRKSICESLHVDQSAYKMWVAFINKFGIEETARILASYDSGLTSSPELSLEDIIAEYDGDFTTDEVSDALNNKAASLGLSDDSAYPYSFYTISKYDMFLYNHLRDSSYLYVAYQYDIVDELEKALSNKDKVYLVISDGVSEEYQDDTLMWDDAIDALRERFNVLSEGLTKRENKQYAILADKYRNIESWK